MKLEQNHLQLCLANFSHSFNEQVGGQNYHRGRSPREIFIKFCDNTERLVVLTNTCLRVGLVKGWLLVAMVG